MLISGIVLYFKPEGSIARWLDWRIWGITKSGWESLHTVFSFIFLVFAVLHILKVNLGILKVYFSKYRSIRAYRELNIALFISVLFFIGTLLSIPPFHMIYQAGDYLSDSWGKKVEIENEAIEARQELSEVAGNLGIEENKPVKILEEKGYEHLQRNRSLQEIAGKNGVSPYTLYQHIRSEASDKVIDRTNRIYKNITLEEMAVILDIKQSRMVKLAGDLFDLQQVSGNTDLLYISGETNSSPEEIKARLISEVS
jgi:DNA-binding phage protein